LVSNDGSSDRRKHRIGDSSRRSRSFLEGVQQVTLMGGVRLVEVGIHWRRVDNTDVDPVGFQFTGDALGERSDEGLGRAVRDRERSGDTTCRRRSEEDRSLGFGSQNSVDEVVSDSDTSHHVNFDIFQVLLDVDGGEEPDDDVSSVVEDDVDRQIIGGFEDRGHVSGARKVHSYRSEL